MSTAAGGTARGVNAPLDRIPDIDYRAHPLFTGGGPRPGMSARLVGYLRYAGIVGYVVGTRLRQLAGRRRWTERGATPHLDALRRDGIVPLRLAPPAREALLGAAEPYFDQLAERRRAIPRGRRGYADGQLDTTRESAPELFAAVERALADAGILASVRAYLGSRAEVRKVTVQINDEWDSFWRAPFESRGLPLPDTGFFHVDNTYGVVKVIVYASEVGAASGPFSYVPGTNRLRTGLLEGLWLRATDIWIDVWPANGALLPSLPRALRRRAKFGDDIPPDAEWGRRLLAQERVLTSADGDALLFDVGGIHRGGLVARGERRILQIMMR
ncbi:MAG: hypothetical protein KGL38_09325 [Gemmatimonadota bacterium]|nr:hypothetical protein [Gemmatimonadota bacterium]